MQGWPMSLASSRMATSPGSRATASRTTAQWEHSTQPHKPFGENVPTKKVGQPCLLAVHLWVSLPFARTASPPPEAPTAGEHLTKHSKHPYTHTYSDLLRTAHAQWRASRNGVLLIYRVLVAPMLTPKQSLRLIWEAEQARGSVSRRPDSNEEDRTHEDSNWHGN
jgi:hypothetical protein